MEAFKIEEFSTDIPKEVPILLSVRVAAESIGVSRMYVHRRITNKAIHAKADKNGEFRIELNEWKRFLKEKGWL